MSHYILIAVSTQTNNKSKILINVVQYACKKACESLEDMRFFNNAVKGVPCDSVMIQEAIHNHIYGDVCYVDLIDTNHDVKNNWYQIIGGS